MGSDPQGLTPSAESRARELHAPVSCECGFHKTFQDVERDIQNAVAEDELLGIGSDPAGLTLGHNPRHG